MSRTWPLFTSLYRFPSRKSGSCRIRKSRQPASSTLFGSKFKVAPVAYEKSNRKARPTQKTCQNYLSRRSSYSDRLTIRSTKHLSLGIETMHSQSNCSSCSRTCFCKWRTRASRHENPSQACVKPRRRLDDDHECYLYEIQTRFRLLC